MNAVLSLSNALVFLKSSDRQFALSVVESLSVRRIVRKKEERYDSPSTGGYTFDDLARYNQLELLLTQVTGVQ